MSRAANESNRGPSAQPRGPVWGIVLAAGSGSRFGSAKQFISIAGHRPVDLAVAAAVDVCDHVVLVLPEGRPWDGVPVDHVVIGGGDRLASVRRGLAVIADTQGIVVVHQAANPLASVETFIALVSAVRDGAPAAVPGLRPADVVRRSVETTSGATVAGDLLGRDDLVLVQTPAAFRIEVLRAAHAAPGGAAQEDTALVSAAGHAVRLVPGDPRNVHLATADDFDLVRALLIARSVGSVGDRPAMNDGGVSDDDR